MSNLNLVFSLIFSIIDSLIYLYLLSIFIKDKNNHGIFTGIAFIVLISILIFSLTHLGIAIYIKISIISIIFFIITYCYKMEFYERILLIVLYYFIIIASELLVTFFISNILKVDINSVAVAYKYSFLFLGAISKFVTIIIILIIKQVFNNKRVMLPRFLNYTLIFILLLFSLLMILLFSVTIILISEQTYYVLFLICLFLLIISGGVLIIYFYANNFYVTLQKEIAKHIYNKSYENFIVNAKIREDSLSKIWHDLNNHIIIMEKMYESGINNIEYFKSLKDKIILIPNNIKSGNEIIDIILNEKYLHSISLDITFNMNVIAPPKLNIKDLDISSILFNTIDNSIESCIKQDVGNKYINLELYPKGNFLYYKIENSCNFMNTAPIGRKYLGKKKYIQEGYGLRIIKDIVEKYNGYMDIIKIENKYTVTIILDLTTTHSNK